MPNFCENQCSFGGPTDQIKAVFDLITTDDHKEITFNKLIPMPDILERVQRGGAHINGIYVRAWIEDPGPDGKPIQRFLTAEEHAAIQSTGHKDWWDWRIAKWGCKWDASESQIQPPDLSCPHSHFSAFFMTPWGPPDRFFEVLRNRFPAVEMSLFYHEPGVQAAGYL